MTAVVGVDCEGWNIGRRRSDLKSEGFAFALKNPEMKIRAYEESDLEALKAIHARQGFGYAFPDLGNPLFLTKLVLGREEGGKGIAGAAMLRLTAEAYLLLDPELGSPRERWGSLLALHEATRRDALARGLEDVHAWLPPPIAQKFGKRLTRLGWVRDDEWTPYCKRLR